MSLGLLNYWMKGEQLWLHGLGCLRVSGEGWKCGKLGRGEERSRAGIGNMKERLKYSDGDGSGGRKFRSQDSGFGCFSFFNSLGQA